MTDLHERVYLRFRGHTRSLPLASLALVLRRDLDGAARTLDILIHGPPETRESPTENRSPARTQRGEGVGGGVGLQRFDRWAQRSVPTFPTEYPKRSPERLERSDAHARDHDTDDGALAREVAIDLGDEENVAAIRVLVARYPRHLIARARTRTLAVPADRVRASRGALFTGIVRALASEHDPTQ